MLRHIDLFSGIGGFAYAADQVFEDVEHIFCDNDKFCQQVLTKHWPEAKIYDDIRDITDTELKGLQVGQAQNDSRLSGTKRDDSAAADTKSEGLEQGREAGRQTKKGSTRRGRFTDYNIDLLTGGFPCQPFSAAGLRKGTADDRHLWPEMLRVIKLTKPTWVIAENVRGLLTWDEGMVFEQVCADLEAEGYEVQPFIIPAVAVNAPHRRDRVWFVAYRQSEQDRRLQQSDPQRHAGAEDEQTAQDSISQRSGGWRDGLAKGEGQRLESEVQATGSGSDVANSETERLQQGRKARSKTFEGDARWRGFTDNSDWSQNWIEVATELCGVDDGLPAELDGFKLTKSQHRKERLKSLGNAIVPQVAMEIMRGMV